ncbi:hypothetical protein ACRAWF_39535 [Streptomyces sp. L7]
MHRARVLGPDVVLVHASKSTPDELRLATETGAPIPLSSGTEARMPGLGIPPTGRVPKFGGTPDVSADTEIVASADLFGSLRSLPVVQHGSCSSWPHGGEARQRDWGTP